MSAAAAAAVGDAAAAIAAAKRALRRDVDARLRARPSSAVARESAQLAAALAPAAWFQGARAVAAFLPMPHEVQTLPALRAAVERGARVYVPRVTGPRSGDMAFVRLVGLDEVAQLPRDRWGIPTPGEAHAAADGGGAREPLDPACVDVVLVPGVAFDVHGARLGHGKGYYGACVRACGAASAWQAAAGAWARSPHRRRRRSVARARALGPATSPRDPPPARAAALAPCRRVPVAAAQQAARRGGRRRDEGPRGGAFLAADARAHLDPRVAPSGAHVPCITRGCRGTPPRPPLPSSISHRGSHSTASSCPRAASPWRRMTCGWTCSRRPRGSLTAGREPGPRRLMMIMRWRF